MKQNIPFSPLSLSSSSSFFSLRQVIKEAIGNERDFDLMICVDSDKRKRKKEKKEKERRREKRMTRPRDVEEYRMPS